MKCPYCGGEMIEGKLHAIPHDTVYWLPEGVDLNSIILTTKRIEEYGGIVLCETMNTAYTGFVKRPSAERPVSFCCKGCRTIFTKF